MPDTPISREAAIEAMERGIKASFRERHIPGNIEKELRELPEYDPRRPPSERPEERKWIVVEWTNSIVPECVYLIGDELYDRDRQWRGCLDDIVWWEPIRTGPLGENGE